MRNIAGRTHTNWTEEMEQRLWDMFQEGKHPSEVALALGVTQAAAISRHQKIKRRKAAAND